MKKLYFLIATGMAMFLDLSFGMVFSTVSAKSFDIPIQWWYPLVGAVLAVLPDFDIVWPILARIFLGKNIEDNHHASVMHWPLVMLPMVTTLGWFIGGWCWATLAFGCITFHYLHDALIMGWPAGFVWLTRTKQTPIYDPSATLTYDVWIEQKWLQPSKLSTNELATGLCYFGIAIGLVTGSIIAGMFVTFMGFVGVLFVWQTYPTLKT